MVDQHKNAYRAKIHWLTRNPGAFVERFVRGNQWEFETVWPPTPFYPKTDKRPLPVLQKDRVPPQILQKSPARHQTFRPPVLPVPSQPVIPLWVVKLTPQYPQTKLRTIAEGTSREQTSQRPQAHPRVIPASQYWKEIRLSRKEDWILQTSGVVIPIHPINSGSAATVEALSIIREPVAESVRGLFHRKPQAPAHVLNLTTLVLNNLINI